MKTETACVHAGGRPDPATRGINTPVFTSSAFEYLDGESRPYPRYFNTPNQLAVVEKLCALEGAEDGVVLSSELVPAASPDRFLHALSLIRAALSLGGVESTICAPATTSHVKVTAEVRRRMGISDGLLRLSVGIEHPDDPIADLTQALEKARAG